MRSSFRCWRPTVRSTCPFRGKLTSKSCGELTGDVCSRTSFLLPHASQRKPSANHSSAKACVTSSCTVACSRCAFSARSITQASFCPLVATMFQWLHVSTRHLCSRRRTTSIPKNPDLIASTCSARGWRCPYERFRPRVVAWCLYSPMCLCIMYLRPPRHTLNYIYPFSVPSRATRPRLCAHCKGKLFSAFLRTTIQTNLLQKGLPHGHDFRIGLFILLASFVCHSKQRMHPFSQAFWA